jgi:hypothetical protein
MNQPVNYKPNEPATREWARCRCCGGREVKRTVIRDGDREWVVVECKFCDQRRGAYYRKAKKTGGSA